MEIRRKIEIIKEFFNKIREPYCNNIELFYCNGCPFKSTCERNSEDVLQKIERK